MPNANDTPYTLQQSLRDIADYCVRAAESLDDNNVGGAEGYMFNAVEGLREVAHAMQIEF